MTHAKTALIASAMMLTALPALAQSSIPAIDMPASTSHAPVMQATPVARLSRTGAGRIYNQLNIAMLSIGVQVRTDTAKEAVSQNADRLTEVIRRLCDAGIKDKDIQTSGLTTGQNFSGGSCCPVARTRKRRPVNTWRATP